MYDYDDNFAYLVDTKQQCGLVKTNLENLAKARNVKGPMSSRNLSYIITIKKKETTTISKDLLVKAIRNNAVDYINPPIKNVGYKGIQKTSTEITKWFERSKNSKEDLSLVATLIEQARTWGSLFRNIYIDFLNECLTIFDDVHLKKGYNLFAEIAPMWKEITKLIQKTGETKEMHYLEKASSILLEILTKELEAMTELLKIGD